MSDAQIVEALAQCAVSALCSAHPDVRAMRSSIAPLYRGAKLCGPAKTAMTEPGQNAAIHRAVATAERGHVLVVDGRSSTAFGPFGDILATACRNRGIVGAVFDCTIRDTAEIADLQFPVFCLGANPASTAKTDPGEIDVEIYCGGVRVCPGDFIVGDDDGVVVVPKAVARDAVSRVAVVLRKEDAIKAQLAEGKTTCEIFGIAV